MQIEKKHGPSGTIMICHLEQGECLIAEGGALLAYRGEVNIETTIRQKNGDGLLKSLRRILSGESLFLNHFTALKPSAVTLGTPLPGDIFEKELQGEKLIIQSGSYVAHTAGVEIDLQWQGLKSIFSGAGLFWLKARGHGKVIVNSFGSLFPVDVDGEYIVDTGHIVAFEETLNFEISKVSDSWIGAYLSGEGFICRFKGHGRIWCQSHNPSSFGYSLRPYLKPKQG